jgi:cellulose synthase/poly-beta-1,6-N-acetylglucosamine synthase-like glycosyltransferase
MLYDFLMLVFTLLCSLIIAHLLFIPLLNILGLLMGQKKLNPINNANVDFGIVVTAYKDLEVCESLIASAIHIKQIPHHIYIVADQVPTSDLYKGLPKISIIFPVQPLNSKVKSIEYGMQAFLRPHNYTLVLDPDNVITEKTLQKMTTAIQAGYEAVQAKRVAKNLDSNAAKLDALGEAFYNWCREIYFRLGGFVTLAGSGMAIKTSILKKMLNAPELIAKEGEVIAGEDKIFQSLLCDYGVVVAFVNDALVLDEKIGDFKKMQRQRTRWLKANFDSKPKATKLFLKGLFSFDMQKILLGYEEVKLPNSFLFISSFLFAGSSLFINYKLGILIICSLFIFIGNFFLSAKLAGVSPKVFSAVAAFPQLVVAQIGALFGMSKAKKDFLVTEKRKINI